MQKRYGVLLLGIGALALAAFVVLSSGQNASTPANTTTLVVNGGQITPAQYQSTFDADAPHTLLDVRTPDEFASGHIADAVNISVETLGGRLAEVPKDQPVVVYCRTGRRSAEAAAILREAGYTSVYDLGGIQAWSAAGLPVTQ